MNFDYTPKVQALREKMLAFFDEHIYPNERAFAAEIAQNRQNGNAWIPTELIESLKQKARDAGLWNLFLPDSERGAGLTNLEYAPLCEIMGRVPNDRALRQRREQARMAPAAAAGAYPLGVPDDGAGGGVVGCDEHPVQHRARRR